MVNKLLGKSHLTGLYCIVRCILYPGTKIVIAAGTRGQSTNVISEKIKGFYDSSVALQREIIELKTGVNEPYVGFANGSWIKVVTANDNARSARANVLVVDEFRMVDLDVIKKVLRKFLTTRRQPGYLKHEEYKNMQEPNTEIYLSSAWMKTHWSWARYSAYKEAMMAGKRYFTCALPYQLGIKEGILDGQRIIDEITEEDFDIFSFNMEMACLPYGESEKAYFKFDELNHSRKIKKPLLPLSDEEFVQFKGDRKKQKFYKQKHPNEIRILGVDIALMGGHKNDASNYILIRGIQNGNEYTKSIDYIETVEGKLTGEQTLRLKQLFYDLECDFVAMDTSGNALGVFDECTKITYDSVRGVEYPAWASINDEKMQERGYDRNAVPVIYSIKVAGSTANALNHEMAMYVKTQFEKKKIQILCNELEAKDYLVQNFEYHKMTSEELARIVAPYFFTTRLINEMINLEMEVRNGFIKLVEPIGQRKDRYSSLAYGLYYFKLLESELRNSDEDVDDLEVLKQYYV